MQLTADQFAEIAGPLATGKQLKGEKRGATRVPLGRRSAVLGKSGPMTVVIREISITGASMVASQAVSVGERLTVCVPRLQGPDLQVRCSVLRCERGVGGRVFVIGLKFDEVLPTLGIIAPQAPVTAREAKDVSRIRQAMLEA